MSLEKQARPRKRPTTKAAIERLTELAEQGVTEEELAAEAATLLGSSSFQTVDVPHFHYPSRQEIGNAHVRMVKMLKPECNADKMRALGLPESDACQRGKMTPLNWYENCPHEPYMTFSEKKARKPILEPILDNGQETGRHRITDYEEEVWVEKAPNTRQVAVNRRINSGLGMNDALMKGFRLPSTSFCDYPECWSQDIVVKSKYGNYCSDIQARYVAADARQVKLFVDGERRADQIAGVSL